MPSTGWEWYGVDLLAQRISNKSKCHVVLRAVTAHIWVVHCCMVENPNQPHIICCNIGFISAKHQEWDWFMHHGRWLVNRGCYFLGCCLGHCLQWLGGKSNIEHPSNHNSKDCCYHLHRIHDRYMAHIDRWWCRYERLGWWRWRWYDTPSSRGKPSAGSQRIGCFMVG